MSEALKRYGVQAALVGIAAVWGGTFVMVKDAVAGWDLYAFLGWRFAIAVVAFCVLFPRSLARLNLRTVRAGVVAGVFLTGGYIFQTWGLEHTTASKAAFITGMFIVVTPVLQAVLLRRRPSWATVAGVAVAVVGLWLISGADGSGWGVGDTLVFLCAVAYSFHMIVLGAVGKHHDIGALTLVQLLTVAVVCLAVSFFAEDAGMPRGGSLWMALLVTGVLASAVAFAVQTYAQRYIPPARTALILITEPAFGGLFGWLAGDAFGAAGFGGAALILGGMILSEVVGAKAASGEKVIVGPSMEGPPVPVLEQE